MSLDPDNHLTHLISTSLDPDNTWSLSAHIALILFIVTIQYSSQDNQQLADECLLSTIQSAKDT